MEANFRVREACLVCEGSGRNQGGACAYCQGSGHVFSRTQGPAQVLVATGDCKVPARLKPAQGMNIVRSQGR